MSSAGESAGSSTESYVMLQDTNSAESSSEFLPTHTTTDSSTPTTTDEGVANGPVPSSSTSARTEQANQSTMMNRIQSTLTTRRPSALVDQMDLLEDTSRDALAAAARHCDEVADAEMETLRYFGPAVNHLHPLEENGVISECMRHEGEFPVLDLPLAPFVTVSDREETKEEIMDTDENAIAPLPCSFASAYTRTDTASILEDGNNPGSDEALAASMEAQDRELLAMKRAAAHGNSGTEASVVSVTEDFHPSEEIGVQAEFLGQDYFASVEPPLPSRASFSTVNASTSTSSAATLVTDHDSSVEEAVVIDSEPVHKGLHTAREAQVLLSEDTNESSQSEKPCSDNRPRRRSSRRRRWAEVTEIQELPDLHPLERDEVEMEIGTEAQLVGADDSYAVAVPQVGANVEYPSSRNAPQASAVVVNDSGTTEHESTVATAILPEPPSLSDESNLNFAQVMMEDPNVIDQSLLDRKPSARGSSRPRRIAPRNSLSIIAETPTIPEQQDDGIIANEVASAIGHTELGVAEAITVASVSESSPGPVMGGVAFPDTPDWPSDQYDRHLAMIRQDQSQAEVVDIQETRDIHPAEQEEAQGYAEYFGATSLVPHAHSSLGAHVELDRSEAAWSSSTSLWSGPSLPLESTALSTENTEAVASAQAVAMPHDHPEEVPYTSHFDAEVVVENGGNLTGVRPTPIQSVESVGVLDDRSTAENGINLMGVRPTPIQSVESVGVLDDGSTAQVVSIQESGDCHPEERSEFEHDNVADLIGTAIAAQAVESDTTVTHPVLTVAPVAFGAIRELSDAGEATLVGGSEQIRIATTLETATVLPEYDEIEDVKQAAVTQEISESEVEIEQYINTRSDHVDEISYLQRRDREYHQNIASSIGAIEQEPEVRPSRQLSGETVVTNIPSRESSASQYYSLSSSAGITENAQPPSAVSGPSQPQAFPLRRSNSADNLAVMSAVPRTLLPWSVVQNPSTGLWIATLQTNQRALERNEVAAASKSLRVFSMPSEKQALALARAWTPPKMMPFQNQTRCHICQNKFGPFRRACHCRNCGVVVCLKDCANQWPAKMIPDSYNIKKEFYPNVCKSCNWLCNEFRKALMDGDRDHAMAIYSTGNVNLYTPFANVKGELFYPVHCAVLGDSLDLLRFLVDDHCCPIKSVRVGSGRSGHSYTPIVTSKGRSLLGIALSNENLEIVRYLVVEKGASFSEADVTMELLCKNFIKVLQFLPSTLVPTEQPFPPESHGLEESVEALPAAVTQSDPQRSISEEARDFGAVAMNPYTQNNEEECKCTPLQKKTSSHLHMAGIICFDNPINCVASPCMHQMCCSRCSENLGNRCPVCSSDCTFLRVFRP